MVIEAMFHGTTALSIVNPLLDKISLLVLLGIDILNRPKNN